jgi:hypothetical protein
MPAKSPLQKIVELLALLSPLELEELQQRLKALRQFGSATPVSVSVESDEAFVLGCISELLQRLGAPASTLLLQRAAAERVRDGSSFREKVPPLMQFLARAHKDRRGQRALLCLAIEMLWLHMLDVEKVVLSYRTLMANIHRIPGVLDRHFPGFARNGLLPFVVERMDRGMVLDDADD